VNSSQQENQALRTQVCMVAAALSVSIVRHSLVLDGHKYAYSRARDSDTARGSPGRACSDAPRIYISLFIITSSTVILNTQ
jgi:subtilase family serine protease